MISVTSGVSLWYHATGDVTDDIDLDIKLC